MKHIFLLFWLLTISESIQAYSEYTSAGTIRTCETEIVLFNISNAHPDLIEEKPTTSWTSSHLEIRTGNRNSGVFAKTDLKKNELLAIFGGKILTREQVLQLSAELIKNVLQIDEQLWISNGSLFGEVVDYINHSCDPNAGIQGQIKLVAMRDISANEEITFDYATVVSEWIGMEALSCNCSATVCRKIISQDDWKNPVIQQKYKGYFSEYLEKKIQVNNI